MKNVILIAVFLLTAWVGQAVYAQQGFGTNAPDKSAAVEIQSSKRGLLIPRIALTALTNPSPITNPANSLFVFNTASNSEVTPGYYYWEDNGAQTGIGKWVRFISSDDVKTTTVTGVGNIEVTPTTSGDTTNYEVSVKASATEGHVLVTQDTGGGNFAAVWVDPATFVNNAIVIGNGLTKNVADSNRVELGGILTKDTTRLITNGGTNTLAIQGLETVTTYDKVMVLGPNGVLQAADLSSLVRADNGLTINDGSDDINDKGKVQLGGALIQPTTIAADGTNTLAITGLQAAAAANKIVVVEADSVLRTVTRTISSPMNADLVISSLTNYSSFVQEVNISVTLDDTDLSLTLPDPVATNEGQVVNVKITNENDNHDGYLNIFRAGSLTPLTYGALPYQGWVLKSNGSAWLIVGRN